MDRVNDWSLICDGCRRRPFVLGLNDRLYCGLCFEREVRRDQAATDWARLLVVRRIAFAGGLTLGLVLAGLLAVLTGLR